MNQPVHVRLGELEEQLTNFQKRHNLDTKSEAIRFILKHFLDNEEYYINLTISQMQDNIESLIKQKGRLNNNTPLDEIKNYVYDLLVNGKEPMPIIQGNDTILQKLRMNCPGDWREQINEWIREYEDEHPYLRS